MEKKSLKSPPPLHSSHGDSQRSRAGPSSGVPAQAPPPGPGDAGPQGWRQQGQFKEPPKRSTEPSVARLLLSSLRQNKSAPPGLGLNVARWIINSIFPALL